MHVLSKIGISINFSTRFLFIIKFSMLSIYYDGKIETALFELLLIEIISQRKLYVASHLILSKIGNMINTNDKTSNYNYVKFYVFTSLMN